MSINFKLQKQEFQKKDFLIGRVDLRGIYIKEMIIEKMLQMSSMFTPENLVAMFDCLEKTVMEVCLEGFKVNLEGFCQFTPSLSGKFLSSDDRFDRNNHDIYVTAQLSTTFNNQFKDSAKLVKVDFVERKPELLAVYDCNTKLFNTGISPLNMASIKGDNLKFDSSSNEEYLRFVDSGNPANFIKIESLAKSGNKEIVFLIPEIPFQSGYFEIATKLGTQTVRIGRSQVLVTQIS